MLHACSVWTQHSSFFACFQCDAESVQILLCLSQALGRPAAGGMVWPLFGMLLGLIYKPGRVLPGGIMWTCFSLFCTLCLSFPVYFVLMKWFRPTEQRLYYRDDEEDLVQVENIPYHLWSSKSALLVSSSPGGRWPYIGGNGSIRCEMQPYGYDSI